MPGSFLEPASRCQSSWPCSASSDTVNHAELLNEEQQGKQLPCTRRSPSLHPHEGSSPQPQGWGAGAARAGRAAVAAAALEQMKELF